MSDLDFRLEDMYIIVQYLDDESYWVTPLTYVDGYNEWIAGWASDGHISTMAVETTRCQAYNGEKSVALDLSTDPLSCSNEPQHCFREARIIYGPREGLCCTIRAFIIRTMEYRKQVLSCSRAEEILNATQHLRDQSFEVHSSDEDSDETFFEPEDKVQDVESEKKCIESEDNFQDDDFEHGQVW